MKTEKVVPSRVDGRGENGDRSPSARVDGTRAHTQHGRRRQKEWGVGWTRRRVRVRSERLGEVGVDGEGHRGGGEGVDSGVEYRHGVKARTEETEEEKNRAQREQPRALGSRPGPVGALLAALHGLGAPTCEMGMGTHAPLLLCWSGGEAAGKEGRPGDGAGLTPGTCTGLGTRGTPSSHSPSRALAPQNTLNGPPTGKGQTQCRLLPGVHTLLHLVTS